MLNVIIFSKDRAAQLDLCLQSIANNLNLSRSDSYVAVVYTASTPEFQAGYDLVKTGWRDYRSANAYPQVFWLGEKFFGGFKNAFIDALSATNDYVMLMTDDDIVYRQMPQESDMWPEIESAMEKENLLSVSLRLGTNTFVQDQYKNTRSLVPDAVIQSEELIRTWNWEEQDPGSFAYPFSLDGHIFQKKNLKAIVDRISEEGDEDYYNPNSMEGKAQYYLDGMSNLMGCFENSYVINTPLNRVQETCTNKAGEYFEYPAEELNQKLLDGERLILEGMDFSTIIGCHQEVKLCWKKK